MPEGYDGPLAAINDTFERRRGNKVYVFYVDKINGKRVPSAALGSDRVSAGRIDAAGYSRDVLPEILQLTLMAHPQHGAPIAEWLSSQIRAEGEIEFKPEPGKTYLVKGKVEGNLTQVWLADAFGNRVSRIISSDESGPSTATSETEPLPTPEPAPAVKAPVSPQIAFARITAGESESLVREKFGSPASVTRDAGNMFTQRPPTETHHYPKLGQVTYVYGARKALFVDKVEPIARAQRLTPELLAEQLDTDNGLTLIELTESYHRAGVSKPELLSVFALKLEADYTTRDKYVAKGMAYICRILGEGSPGTYDPLLRTVAEEARHRGLRRHARANTSSGP
ncbi:MAG: hypothetical protein AAGI15_03730 [Pseudomonadota bacterium]